MGYESLLKIISEIKYMNDGNYVPGINSNIDIVELKNRDNDFIKNYYLENYFDGVENFEFEKIQNWKVQLTVLFEEFIKLNELPVTLYKKFLVVLDELYLEEINIIKIKTTPERYHSHILAEYLIDCNSILFLLIVDVLPG